MPDQLGNLLESAMKPALISGSGTRIAQADMSILVLTAADLSVPFAQGASVSPMLFSIDLL